MERITEHSSEVLLARVNRELEKISDTQHRLARRKLVLQREATRLRLGASPLEVRLTLQVSAFGDDEHTRLGSDWSEEPRVDGGHHGGGLL